MIKRFKFRESKIWGERLYGLANLVVDLGLHEKENMKVQQKAKAAAKPKAKASSSSSSGASVPKPPSAAAAKEIAFAKKRNSKHCVWQAYLQYADPENLHREWIIAVTTDPLQTWHHEQAEELAKGLEGSFAWLKAQCSWKFWDHIKRTLAIIGDSSNFQCMGIQAATEFTKQTLAEDSLDVYIDQQNELCGNLGDMVLGVVLSRFKWGLDYLHGIPLRGCLLDSEHAPQIAQEVKAHSEVVQSMAASPSRACQQKASFSHMKRAPAMQLMHVLKKADWKTCEKTASFAVGRYSSIESSRMVEEAHRQQNTFVRKNPIHRLSNDAAHYALQSSDLVTRHGFSASTPVVGTAPNIMEAIDPEFYDPKNKKTWEPLKSISGWSATPSWHTTGPDGTNDTIADILVALRLPNLEAMDRAVVFSCLMRGNRLIVQHIEDGKWYLVLGILSDCCPAGVPITLLKTPGFTYRWSLDVKDQATDGWTPLPVSDPSEWIASNFIFESPLAQFCSKPAGVTERTGGRIVLCQSGPVESLLKRWVRAGCEDLSQAAVRRVFTLRDIELESGVSDFIFYEVTQTTLGTSEEGTLEILRARTHKCQKRSEAKALQAFDGFADILTKDEKKEIQKLKEKVDQAEDSRKTFKEEWSAKRKEVRAKQADGKPKAKKPKVSSGFAKEAVDIEEVRARVRLSLEETGDVLEQGDLKVLLPPGTQIWNNWRGQAWRLKMASVQGYHDTEPWCTFGRDGAAWTLIARAWRVWLNDKELPAEACPITDLFAQH